MCQNPSIAWAMIQTMRSIVREGALSASGRRKLSQHRLDALAHHLPVLIDLVRPESFGNRTVEPDKEALPSAIEQCLLDATACALRDPERSRSLLAQCLAADAVDRADELVTAMACALEDCCCQRHHRARTGSTRRFAAVR